MDIIKELLNMNKIKLSKVVHTIVRTTMFEQFELILTTINEKNNKPKPSNILNLWNSLINPCVRILKIDGELDWCCSSVEYYLDGYAHIPIIQFDELILY